MLINKNQTIKIGALAGISDDFYGQAKLFHSSKDFDFCFIIKMYQNRPLV